MGVDVTIYEGHEQRAFADVKQLRTSNGVLWSPDGVVREEVYNNITEKLWGLIDLSGKEFNLKDLLSIVYFATTSTTYSVNFVSNSTSYSTITIVVTLTPPISVTLMYDSTTVYANSTWVSSNYKKIEIDNSSAGSDADNEYLLYWLYKNSADDYSSDEQFDILMDIIGSKIRKNASLQNGLTIDYIAFKVLYP